MAEGRGERWFVAQAELDDVVKRLALRLDLGKGSGFLAPVATGVYVACARSRKTWQNVSSLQHRGYLHARVQCVACEAYGVTVVEVPWDRTEMGFTLLLQWVVLALAKGP